MRTIEIFSRKPLEPLQIEAIQFTGNNFDFIVECFGDNESVAIGRDTFWSGSEDKNSIAVESNAAITGDIGHIGDYVCRVIGKEDWVFIITEARLNFKYEKHN